MASLKGILALIKRSLHEAVRDSLRIAQSIRRSARRISRTDQSESEAVGWAVYAMSASIEDVHMDRLTTFSPTLRIAFLGQRLRYVPTIHEHIGHEAVVDVATFGEDSDLALSE